MTHFAIDPNDPNHVFVSTYGQKVMVTTNGGSSWSPSNTNMTDTGLFNIEISPVHSNIMFATGYVWVWKSVNGSQLDDCRHILH
ncbi:MAG: hypothetical protein IPL78_22885 [Chloroflexi bacterium]|nr:hypothetical protein [Chloroflexota bacterium]